MYISTRARPNLDKIRPDSQFLPVVMSIGDQSLMSRYNEQYGQEGKFTIMAVGIYLKSSSIKSIIINEH